MRAGIEKNVIKDMLKVRVLLFFFSIIFKNSDKLNDMFLSQLPVVIFPYSF